MFYQWPNFPLRLNSFVLCQGTWRHSSIALFSCSISSKTSVLCSHYQLSTLAPLSFIFNCPQFITPKWESQESRFPFLGGVSWLVGVNMWWLECQGAVWWWRFKKTLASSADSTFPLYSTCNPSANLTGSTFVIHHVTLITFSAAIFIYPFSFFLSGCSTYKWLPEPQKHRQMDAVAIWDHALYLLKTHPWLPAHTQKSQSPFRVYKTFQGLVSLSLPCTPHSTHTDPLLFLQSAQAVHPSAPFHVVSRHPQGPPLISFVQSHLGSVTFPKTTISEHCNPLYTPYYLLLLSSCSIALTIFQNNMQVAYLFIGLLPLKTRASWGQRSLSLGFTERAWHILCIEWISVQ